MTTPQGQVPEAPNALRLAAGLCEAIPGFPTPTALENAAALELRRLHAENEALHAQVAALTHPAQVSAVESNTAGAAFAKTMRRIFDKEFPAQPDEDGAYPGWSDHWVIFQEGISFGASHGQAPAGAADQDGEAFRTAARLGLTLRFYGGCAQSSMPGTPSAYEVVAGSDCAAAMREAVQRAATVIANGGESQRLDTPTAQAAPAADYAHGPQSTTVEEAARHVGKWLNERPNRPLDLRDVAMLVAHAHAPAAGAVAGQITEVMIDAATNALVLMEEGTDTSALATGEADYMRGIARATVEAALAAAPTPAAQADSGSLKDHQIAALVNELRDIAVKFHGTQQLRERIAHVVVPALRAGADSGVARSSYGSPELQAMIVARCVEKDRADSGVQEDAARLSAITQAMRDYYYALDNRQHGWSAACTAFDAIQTALGMQQGIEAAARATGAKP